MPLRHDNSRPGGPNDVGQPPLLLALVQLGALAFHVPLAAIASPRGALVGVASAVAVGSVLTGVSFLAYILIQSWSGSGWKALAWVSFALLFFWYWEGSGEAGPLPRWLISGLIAVLSTVAVGRLADERLFRRAAFAASVTLASTLLLSIVWDRLNTPPPVVSIHDTYSTKTFTATPDIVFILLDAYARADVLDSLYDFDNAPFLKGLSEAGFEVSTSANANYTWTHFSVASMLEMSYLVDERDSISNSDLRALKSIISGDNALIDTLKENGYRYVHGDTDHWQNTCGPEVDHCVAAPFIDLTADALLAGTPVGSLLFPGAGDPTTALNLMRLDQLRDWDSFRGDYAPGPTFTFLHLVLPHPPLFLDETCQPRFDVALDGRYMTNGQFTEEELGNRRDAYVDQVQCANRAIRDFIAEIDSEVVVVITSDHGPDSLEPLTTEYQDSMAEQRWERFATLSAIRLPPECERPPADLQLVNTFRVVLGCLTGTEAELLNKHYYIAGYGGAVEELKDPDLDAELQLIRKKEQTL